MQTKQNVQKIQDFWDITLLFGLLAPDISVNQGAFIFRGTALE